MTVYQIIMIIIISIQCAVSIALNIYRTRKGIEIKVPDALSGKEE